MLYPKYQSNYLLVELKKKQKVAALFGLIKKYQVSCICSWLQKKGFYIEIIKTNFPKQKVDM